MFDPSGAPRRGLSVYIMSFVMLISWVLLQMSTVVLLDSFSRASLLIEHEEEEKATSSKRSKEAPFPISPPTHTLSTAACGQCSSPRLPRAGPVTLFR